MAKKTTAEKTLADLFDHALKDIYYAERKIYRTLPKIIKSCQHNELAVALETHREETAHQIERLEQIFELMGKAPKGVRCEAIDGILEEGDGLLEEFGDSAAGDAGIIFACQGVEHYEITRYGTMHEWALELGMEEAAGLLAETLAEEKAADDKLTGLAEASINMAGEHHRRTKQSHQK